MIKDFLAGAGYLVKGFRMIRQPGLRRYFAIPLLLNVLVFVVLGWVGVNTYTNYITDSLKGGDGWWVGTLVLLGGILIGLTVLVLMFFVFTLLLNFIGAPFNGLLSEKIEARLNPNAILANGGMKQFLRNFWPSMLGELKKYLYFLVLGGITLVLSFVPMVNIANVFISILFASWMMALEYMAYPMGNHEQHFPQVRQWAWQNKMVCLGFGSVVLLATLTPVINLVTMPAAVAGATVLWSERRDFFGTSGVA